MEYTITLDETLEHEYCVEYILTVKFGEYKNTDQVTVFEEVEDDNKSDFRFSPVCASGNTLTELCFFLAMSSDELMEEVLKVIQN